MQVAWGLDVAHRCVLFGQCGVIKKILFNLLEYLNIGRCHIISTIKTLSCDTEPLIGDE